MGENAKKLFPISIVYKDFLPGIAAGGKTIDRSGILEPQWTGHALQLSQAIVGLQDLTPNCANCLRADVFVTLLPMRVEPMVYTQADQSPSAR